MPFSVDAKTKMFIKCARLCCLCLKQCGTNIEAAHIVDAHAGGTDDFDNGVPVCFDCHEEIGHYNPKHPKGNKLRPKELVGRRDRVYSLVENGSMFAMIFAARFRSKFADDRGAVVRAPAPKVPLAPTMTEEGQVLFRRLVALDGPPNAAGKKLEMLTPTDRAVVVDALVGQCAQKPTAVAAIAAICRSGPLTVDEVRVARERVIRWVTLDGELPVKVAVLREFEEGALVGLDPVVRSALFEDLIEIVSLNQFADVNELVPVLVNHLDAVPTALHARYVSVLLDHTHSGAYQGGPAARRALGNLPDAMADALIALLDGQYLRSIRNYEAVKPVIARYRSRVPPEKAQLVDDLLTLTPRRFFDRYPWAGDN
jgi:hypothetical protein